MGEYSHDSKLTQSIDGHQHHNTDDDEIDSLDTAHVSLVPKLAAVPPHLSSHWRAEAQIGAVSHLSHLPENRDHHYTAHHQIQ